MRSFQSISVTGIGVATSAGQGVSAFSESLLNGATGIARGEHAPTALGGYLPNTKFDELLSALHLPDRWMASALKNGRRAPRSVQYSILVALEAWQQCGLLASEAYDQDRMALVVAGQNISQNYQYAMFEKFRDSPDYLPPSYGLHFLDTDHVGTISQLLGLRGEGGTVGGASASGNVALVQGMRLIRYGLADVCVVVGTMADLSPVESHAFKQLGAMGGRHFPDEPGRACRPFDADRDGFIFGQGAACLILESEAAATSRGVSTCGSILGGAIKLDANASSNPNAEGEARAMGAALLDADIESGEIDYINTHGSSSVLGDEVEIAAIRALLGTRVSDVWLNGTKELTGHCLWSAGVVEAAATLIQLERGFLHANPNLEHPLDADCRFTGQSVREVRCQTALSNSFGFGGINTSVVLKGRM